MPKPPRGFDNLEENDGKSARGSGKRRWQNFLGSAEPLMA
jgi:hypothetical protein